MKKVSLTWLISLTVFLLCISIGELIASDISEISEIGPATAWDEAEALFQQAAQAESGSVAAVALYSNAALKFESVAKEHYRPGRAWYNAGNAWFEAGELGRSIAAYLHARIYRPFDNKVSGSLQAARALRVERIKSDDGNRVTHWPLRWVKAAFVTLFLLLALSVLLQLRYRERWSLILLSVISLLVLGCFVLLLYSKTNQGKQGVLIAQEILARKGPGYHYTNAFNEPLHNGLEFDLIEVRDEWCLVSLKDGRECWIPERLVSMIDTGS